MAIGAGGTLNWVHGNHLGTPIVTTNARGQVVTPSGYAITGFPGQFANALQLAGAQHFYNRHRDYDPTTGRYIQADPIGLNGDPNPYAYARGNALRYMDPSGEFAPFAVAGVCAFGGCEAAAALVAAGIIWYAAHPIILPENSSPIPIPSSGSDCPDWLGPFIHPSRSGPPRPLPEAEGRPHSIPGRDGGYTTHDGSGGGKQFRPTGKPHGNVKRPNVKEWERDPENPTPSGTRPVGPNKGVRPARPEDFRRRQ